MYSLQWMTLLMAGCHCKGMQGNPSPFLAFLSTACTSSLELIAYPKLCSKILLKQSKIMDALAPHFLTFGLKYHML